MGLFDFITRDKSGKKATKQSPDEGTPLFVASCNGDLPAVRSLIAQGSDPNERSFVNYPDKKLFLTLEKIRRFAAEGRPFQSLEKELYTETMPKEALDLLIADLSARLKNPDRYHRMELGFTTLHYPIMHGDNEIVFALLDAGADPNAEMFNGLFPLYVAAEHGNLPAANKLLEKGADLEKKTPKGNTALRNAVEEGHYDMVKFLLDNGANVEDTNNAGNTIMDAAIYYDRVEITELIKQFISQERSEPSEDQRCDYEVHRNSRMLLSGILENKATTVREAIAAGADVNARATLNGTKYTPLVQAAVERNLEIVEILLDSGANPNFAQMNGETALANAAQNGDYMIALRLLEAGADPNAKTPVGPALAIASNIAIMQLLVEYGADVNMTDPEGDTPIVGAIDTNAYQATYFLRCLGANLEIKNHAGKTPINHACNSRMVYALTTQRYNGPSNPVNIDEVRQEMQLRTEKAREGGYPAWAFNYQEALIDGETIPENIVQAGIGIVKKTNHAAELKRQGDLSAANKMYIEAFEPELPADPDRLWGWFKVLLLAKNFKDARLVLKHYVMLCSALHVYLCRNSDFLEYWADMKPECFKGAPFDGFQAFRQLAYVYPLNKHDVELKIQAFGGSDYWKDYRLSVDEYDTFLRYFGIDSIYIGAGIDEP